jgi:hypothetical protein
VRIEREYQEQIRAEKFLKTGRHAGLQRVLVRYEQQSAVKSAMIRESVRSPALLLARIRGLF